MFLKAPTKEMFAVSKGAFEIRVHLGGQNAYVNTATVTILLPEVDCVRCKWAIIDGATLEEVHGFHLVFGTATFIAGPSRMRPLTHTSNVCERWPVPFCKEEGPSGDLRLKPIYIGNNCVQ